MKSEVPRYAAARLHRSQKSEVRIIHDEYNGYFRAVISELIVTSDFTLHTSDWALKLGSVTPLMKSEVPRYAAARLHRSQKSEVRIIHDEYNGYFRAVISELIVTSDFTLHTSDFKEAPATNLF